MIAYLGLILQGVGIALVAITLVGVALSYLTTID